MTHSHRRHDISNKTWSLLEPHLSGREGSWGGIAKDNRLFINAVFWIMRAGAPWRDKGVWENLLDVLIDEPDYEWLMIDASHCKVQPHAAGVRGGNQDMSRTKGGLTPRYIWPWLRLLCRLESLLQGTRADCTQAGQLIEGINAEYLLADRGYDSNVILAQARVQGMTAVIPPKKN